MKVVSKKNFEQKLSLNPIVNDFALAIFFFHKLKAIT